MPDRPHNPKAPPTSALVTDESSSFGFLRAAAHVPRIASAPRRALQPNDIFAQHYRVIQQLGQGGMGSVYRALDLRHTREVALKVVQAPNAGAVMSLRRETRALFELKHPHIVRLLEHGLTPEGLPWYTMALIEGHSLRRRMAYRMAHTEPLETPPWWTDAWDVTVSALMERESPTSRPTSSAPQTSDTTSLSTSDVEMLKLMVQLCHVLAYLHGEGLVHRDVKPENLMVQETEAGSHLVLVDFGLASPFGRGVGRERLDLVAARGGTASYMAPEQLTDPHRVDARADLYALGCMLFEILTGQRPYEAMQLDQLLDMHRHAPTPSIKALRPALPLALDDLVRHLMHANPTQRPAYALDVARRLEAFIPADTRARLPTHPLPPARTYLYRPTLIGRVDAIASLEGELRGLAAERSPTHRLCLLSGESGIGKSRLAFEVLQRAEIWGVEVMTGACRAPDLGPPDALHPLRASLQRMADQCRAGQRPASVVLEDGDAATLAPYEAALASLLGDQPPTSRHETSPRAARLRAQLALCRVFERAARHHPLLLILDDVQWADPLTLGWLGMLSRRTPDDIPLWILATCRSEAHDVRSSLESQPYVMPLGLERLSEAGIEAMVRSMLALSEVPTDIRHILFEHCEGNPLFVAEYLRTAVHAGLLQRDSQGHWALQRAAEDAWQHLELPTEIGALVQHRLRTLSGDAAHLAGVASLIGRHIDAEVLEKSAHHVITTPSTDNDPLAAVDTLLRAHILEWTHDGTLSFVHGKIREAIRRDVWERLGPNARIQGHRAIAQAMHRHPNAEAMLGDCARHWDAAGDATQARPCYLAAAEHAKDAVDFHDANVYYTRFFELQPDLTHEHVEARLSFAKILGSISELQRALTQAERGLEEARDLRREHPTLRSHSLEGRALIRLAHELHMLGHMDRALEVTREAEPHFKAANDIEGLGMCGSFLGHCYCDLGRLKEAEPPLRDALEHFRRAQVEDPVGPVLTTLALVFSRRNDHDGAEHLYKEALQHARMLGRRDREARVLGDFAGNMLNQGRPAEAIVLYEAALACHRALGNPLGESVALSDMAIVYQELGDFDRALSHYQHSLVIRRETGVLHAQAITLKNIGTVYFETGQLDAARGHLEDALAIFRHRKSRFFEGVTTTHLADVELAAGNLERCDQLLDLSIPIHQEVEHKAFEGYARLLRAAVHRRRNQLDDAERALAHGESIIEALSMPYYRALALGHRGHFELASGRSAATQLSALRPIVHDLSAAPASELGQTLARLERAEDAFQRGEPLRAGEAP